MSRRAGSSIRSSLTGTPPTGTGSSARWKWTEEDVVPKLKREEWFDIARDVDWSYSYVDEATIFPEWQSGLGKIPRDAFRKWDEPYKVSYPEYVANQREK